VSRVAFADLIPCHVPVALPLARRAGLSQSAQPSGRCAGPRHATDRTPPHSHPGPGL